MVSISRAACTRAGSLRCSLKPRAQSWRQSPGPRTLSRLAAELCAPARVTQFRPNCGFHCSRLQGSPGAHPYGSDYRLGARQSRGAPSTLPGRSSTFPPASNSQQSDAIAPAFRIGRKSNLAWTMDGILSLVPASAVAWNPSTTPPMGIGQHSQRGGPGSISVIPKHHVQWP
ncbi:hypothetical protein NEOLEDRAFT_307365 [Neolentinus lepideus HHB14362 ss-1]|uniref:Uncharacterized protein n=1 Tax=Neolentinus lepideus HHB14362 ss-1 TaxID=1314782 RepID=A0A165VRP4_9AGAM|nr:hypothetical protein NEOLEDRAFT_307365 [Neolentinus lepideus HHB14362 ss-1]